MRRRMYVQQQFTLTGAFRDQTTYSSFSSRPRTFVFKAQNDFF